MLVCEKTFKEKLKNMFKRLLFASFLLCAAHSAAANGLKHDFIVHIGPFDAGRTSFEYNFTPRTYEARSSVETNGLFDLLYPFKAQYLTSGLIRGDESFQTKVYKYHSQTRSNYRTKEMIYDDKGLPVYRLSSKNDSHRKVDISYDPKNEGTTDLQTVFANIARQYTELRFCDSRMEVFDGKHRFAVVFKDEGDENLTASEISPFGGRAHKCSLYIDKLNNEGDDLLWQITSERPIYFWILEDQTSRLPFIARVNIPDTPLGELNVYTGKITIKDTPHDIQS